MHMLLIMAVTHKENCLGEAFGAFLATGCCCLLARCSPSCPTARPPALRHNGKEKKRKEEFCRSSSKNKNQKSSKSRVYRCPVINARNPPKDKPSCCAPASAGIQCLARVPLELRLCRRHLLGAKTVCQRNCSNARGTTHGGGEENSKCLACRTLCSEDAAHLTSLFPRRHGRLAGF